MTTFVLAIALGIAGQTAPSHVVAQQTSVTLRVNLRAETADVMNRGDAVLDIGGWVLVSVRGDQRFTFPRMTLAPGTTVTVTSGPNARNDPPRYLRWTTRNIWNNGGDPGRLYDSEGNLVASTG